MTTIKRLKIDVNFDDVYLRGFHTCYETITGDPATMIEIDNKQYSGTITMEDNGDGIYTIIINTKEH